MPGSDETEKQEEMKLTPIQVPWRIFFWKAFLFCLILGLGIATAFKINKILEIQKITPPPIPFWQFVLFLLLATLFILFLIRFMKFKRGKGIIFKTIFILAFGFGGLLFFSVWILDILALILILVLIFWWLSKPSVLIHNLCLIFGIAGVGSVLGLRFDPLMVVVLLILFSIYDFIAVYKTKHMIKMAKEMIEHKAILALIVPLNIFGFSQSLKEIKPGGGKFLILGGGDIIFPLLLAASLVPAGILNSLIVAFFALVGLFVSFWFFVSQKVPKPIPALPPIALFSIIGYLITLLILNVSC